MKNDDLMQTQLDRIEQRLTNIEQMLETLSVPVAAQTGRQIAGMTLEEIKANNKAILAASRERRKRKAS